jgi:YVTN family beta-propeller protein
MSFAAVAAVAAVLLAPLWVAHATPPALDVVAGVRTGSLPKGVTIARDGQTLYVTNYGNANARNISLYNPATLELTGQINVPGIVVESAVSPDGRTLYVSNFTRGTVQFIDLHTRRVRHEVRAGSHPKVLVLSRDGTRLFAANWGSHDVTEIDVAHARVTRTLRAGRNPRGMAITASGRLYIANFNSHTIDVYDGALLDRRQTINPVCRIPRHLVLSPDEHTLYVSCFSLSKLLAIDTETHRVTHEIAIGTWPKSIDVTSDGRYVVSANYGGSSVSVVDTSDWTVNTLDVPAMDHASGVVAALQGTRFFVTGWYDAHLYALDVAGSAPSWTISAALRASTLRSREYHRRHPTE